MRRIYQDQSHTGCQVNAYQVEGWKPRVFFFVVVVVVLFCFVAVVVDVVVFIVFVCLFVCF